MNKTTFIGNFAPDWFFESETRRSQSNAGRRWDFVTIARLAPEKNLCQFIRLFAEVSKHTDKVLRAAIVGDGPEKNKLAEYANFLGVSDKLDFVGSVSRRDVPHILDQSKIFVITSFFEGFPTTLLEAHARGVPCVVTRSAGHGADVVMNTPRTGVVLPSSESISLSDAESTLDLLEHAHAMSKDCIGKAREYDASKVFAPLLDWSLSCA